MYHQFLSLEEKTGLVVGFDGCMAEDSHSFFDAFQKSSKEKNTGKWHRRPAEIFAGKLGDLSLRMGRYKLVRFNPPKDRRTGPNAQHLRLAEFLVLTNLDITDVPTPSGHGEKRRLPHFFSKPYKTH